MSQSWLPVSETAVSACTIARLNRSAASIGMVWSRRP